MAFVFFALVIPIEVVFAIETLDAGDAGYGALLASWGAGMVIGSFAFAGLGSVPLPVLLALSTLAIGAAYLGTRRRADARRRLRGVGGRRASATASSGWRW